MKDRRREDPRGDGVGGRRPVTIPNGPASDPGGKARSLATGRRSGRCAGGRLRVGMGLVALLGAIPLAAASAGSATGEVARSGSGDLAPWGSGERSNPGDASVQDRPVILITGSTGGLGREVALEMASQGAHVIIHGRNAERGREVVAAIEAEGRGSADFHAADLASLDDVRAFAGRVLGEYDRLDALVNNAGIWLEPEDGRLLNEAGVELHFQVNYLSHFLLTEALLPLLLRSGTEERPARIINVASTAQRPLDFDDVMMEDGYSDGRGYAQSKLAQILHTVDLAEALAGEPVIAVALHPATMMDTGMVLARGAQPRASVDDGTAAVVNLLVAPGLESGQYFNGLQPTRANDQAYDEDARRQLRELSRRLVGG